MIKRLFFFLFLILVFDFLLLKPTSPPLIPTPKLTTHFPASPVGGPPSSQPITLIVTGDVMLGRSVNAKMKQLSDFTYPFLKTADFLKSADLTLINLESPLVSGCPTTNTGMIFCADPKAIEGLKFAGIDLVNLANNHIRNYGESGVRQTLEILNQNEISASGEVLVIKEIKGIKFGFLGFDLTSGYQETRITEETKKAKNQVDILIVSFHWGIEYAKKPTQKQIELVHRGIDAGADLIIGHHPHVIQPTEEYKGKLIIYSLGNFIFDQPWSEKTKRGLVGKFTFQDKKLLKSEFLEIYIQDFYQPKFVSPQPKGLGD